jgi:hypothetical protein
MKKFIVVLAMIFAIALLAQPKAQAGVFFRFGLPIPVPVPVFYGPAYYPGMALKAMHITRDPTGAIGLGLTDTGATIEKVPFGISNPSLSIVHSKYAGQASRLSLA